MKLHNTISWFVIFALIMTSISTVSMTAFAETTDTSTLYSEDFEEYADTNYQNTLLGLKDYGWYMADQDTLYTNVSTVAPYSTYSYKLAKIVTKDGGKCLQVVSPGEKSSKDDANIPNFGYGKTFPGVPAGEAATGSWEISFDFKPALINNSTQFSFTLNTSDGSDSTGKIATHNIISGYGQRFYLGYRDHTVLLNNGVTQGTLKAGDIGGLTWYRVKTILNCDARYYSVELYNRSTGELIARRSPVSFGATESVGFLKFSALGYSQAYYVYVDNISIEKKEQNRDIYNETFETYKNDSYVADEGMTTGGSSEYVKGKSYFEGHTPWRYHQDIGNSYTLETDIDIVSQVVRLGDLPTTEEATEASGLVYMPAFEPLLNRTTEPLRGMLKMSFKIKPETITDDVTVNVIQNASEDITSDDSAIFRITNNGGTPQFVKGNGDNIPLNASEWYNAEMTFDVIGRKVTTVICDLDGNEVVSDAVSGDVTPYAVRAIMFRVDGGSSVLMDDINLQYCPLIPFVDENGIVLTDRFGETVTDLNNVTTALKTIEIPMGCPIDGETANASTILLRDSGGNTVGYTASIPGNSYILELDGVLGLNEEYTVIIPQTVANTSGDELGSDVTFTFRTLNQIIDISAVNVNDAPFGFLSGITAGDTVNVALSYNNDTNTDINSIVLLAFYSGDKLVDVQSVGFTALAGTNGADDITAEFTVPDDIDMNTVDGMSIFVWDGLKNIKPLSRNIGAKKVSGKYKDYVDFEVNVESGREAVILQLTDPQIIDATQVRDGVAFSQQKRDFWQPSLMNKRLFNDLRALIEDVDPDLILVTGDLVYGGYDDAGTSFTRFADFMDGFDIPWAPVFGNHDNESTKGVDWQCDYLENCENCLFKQRTLTGNGNYSIGIIQGGELKRVIFMLDSNGCAVMSDESFANGHSKKSAGFGEDQIAWYTSAAEKINRDFKNIKYTFAFHIQLAAFEDALYNTYGFVNGGQVDENKNLVSPLNIDEREDKKPTDFGYIGRSLKGPWDEDRSVYNGMKALGADSILVGHEHCNSASVVYDGIRFQYGQKIGEYDRINFRRDDGSIIGYIAIETSMGTPVLGGTVMKMSESTGEIDDAYIKYCDK